MNYSEVIKAGKWPALFLNNLVSPTPKIGVSSNTKVVYKCSKHGEYSKSIKAALRYSGCPKCSMERAKRKVALERRKSNPFSSEAMELIKGSPDKDKILNGEVSVHQKVTLTCPVHGNFVTTIHSIMDGFYCPECRKEKITRQKRVKDLKAKSYPDWFIEKIKESPDSEKILSGEVLSDTKVRWICQIHGEYRRSLRSHFYYGGRCPTCSKIEKFTAISQKRRAANPFSQEFIDELGPEDAEKARLGLLKASDYALFLCPVHGEYVQRVTKHLSGQGCPECGVLNASRNGQLSIRKKNPFPQWFIDDLEGSPDKEAVLSGKFPVRAKVSFLCKEHGFYTQSVDSHLYSMHGCPTCAAQISSFGSKMELEIADFLRDKGVEVIAHYRNLIHRDRGRPMELDIYLPDYSVAVEFNGLYWHSVETIISRSVSHSWSFEEAKNYHKTKYDKCKESGVRLINVWEDDYRERKETVLSMILSKLSLLNRVRVAARDCRVDRLNYEDAVKFFDEFHIQGAGQGVPYGLWRGDILLSAILVIRAKPNEVDRGSHVLNRYASRRGYFVIGGFEKLCKYAERELLIRRWVTYADLSYSEGDLYTTRGWKLVSKILPDYKYLHRGVRYHKFNFRIERFKNDPNLKYEEGLTESELAHLNGLRRIYDCGKLKFEKVVVQD